MTHWHLDTPSLRSTVVYDTRAEAEEAQRIVEGALKRPCFTIGECSDPVCRAAEVVAQAELDAAWRAMR